MRWSTTTSHLMHKNGKFNLNVHKKNIEADHKLLGGKNFVGQSSANYDLEFFFSNFELKWYVEFLSTCNKKNDMLTKKT